MNALTPVVERALDGPDVVEALGHPDHHDDDGRSEPRADGSGLTWGASEHALERLD